MRRSDTPIPLPPKASDATSDSKTTEAPTTSSGRTDATRGSKTEDVAPPPSPPRQETTRSSATTSARAVALARALMVLQSVGDRGWYYVDGEGRLRGPHDAETMRGWASFFHPKQRVTRGTGGSYVAVGQLGADGFFDLDESRRILIQARAALRAALSTTEPQQRRSRLETKSVLSI